MHSIRESRQSDQRDSNYQLTTHKSKFEIENKKSKIEIVDLFLYLQTCNTSRVTTHYTIKISTNELKARLWK